MEHATRFADTVTTEVAAKIVGIGYEGLRSYLKRGLLGTSGLLTPFVGRDTEAPDPAPRAKWRRFGVVDLCLLRLAKQLMDAGLAFTAANTIASNPEVRRLFQGCRPSDALILTWHPFGDFITFDKESLAHLPARLEDLQRIDAVNTLIYLAPIWDEVHSQVPATEVTASADVATVRNASPKLAAAVLATCSTKILSKGDA